MGQVRSSIIKKINNSVEGDKLIFSQQELEYFIRRWIGGNYNNIDLSLYFSNRHPGLPLAN
jgi:hypothetical protein